MKPSFRATTPADAENLGAFLRRTLNARPDNPMLSVPAMQWKYWDERPDWDGSRSYIVERDEQIVAHGAAWPVHLEGPTRLTGFYLYDWAADPASPGMGAAVLQRMANLVDLVWVAGGTAEAHRMRAATGFHTVAELSIHALPLRPARLEMARERHGWKTPARWLRNVGLRYRAPAAEPGWQAVLCPPECLSPPSTAQPVFHSSLGFAAYYFRCPVARVRWYEVRHKGAYKGFFLLVATPGQVKLAEAAVQDADDRKAWQNLATLAAQAALDWPDANEIALWTTSPAFNAGLTDAGFLPRGKEELMVRDPGCKLAATQVHFQLLNGDTAFLHSGRPAYLC